MKEFLGDVFIGGRFVGGFFLQSILFTIMLPITWTILVVGVLYGIFESLKEGVTTCLKKKR